MIYYKTCKNFMKWDKPIYFYTVACIQIRQRHGEF